MLTRWGKDKTLPDICRSGNLQLPQRPQEYQQVRWKKMPESKQLSNPPAGKCHPRRKREDEELTCPGFHFPAFQDGRRKRTDNGVRKQCGEWSGNVPAWQGLRLWKVYLSQPPASSLKQRLKVSFVGKVTYIFILPFERKACFSAQWHLAILLMGGNVLLN